MVLLVLGAPSNLGGGRGGLFRGSSPLLEIGPQFEKAFKS